MMNFKETKNKSALSTRWAQMSKQEQIIERKKMEIQAKVEAQKQAAALAAQAKLSNSNKVDTSSGNIFSNDGSFMSQYKALLEKQKYDKERKEQKEKLEEENHKKNEPKQEYSELQDKSEIKASINEQFSQDLDERNTLDRSTRDLHHRWNDRGSNRRHSPTTPIPDEQNKVPEKSNIPSLMQIPVIAPESCVSNSQSRNQWTHGESDTESETNSEDKKHMGICPPGSGTMGSGQIGVNSLNSPQLTTGSGPVPTSHGPMSTVPMRPGHMGPGAMGPGPMGPGPMGPGPMGPGPMGPGPMGPGSMGPGPMRPGPMGPGPMVPGPMGPCPVGSGSIGPHTMGPNMDAMGPVGTNGMGPNQMGPNGAMNMCQNMPPGPNGGPRQNIPNMGPIMPTGGPNMPPMPPFLGGPNFPMPPNFMGPNGPRGPCGPGSMPLNMCGPNMRGPGPNGPMPPFFGPPFANPRMMGPNGPPNSMMPPNSMNNIPFMGSPPFGPNSPNFGPNGPFRHGPPNMPFMSGNQLPPNSMHNILESKSMDVVNIPPPESTNPPNIPPPLPLNHMPKPKELDPALCQPGNMPAPPNTAQVLSADMFPPPVQRAAAEVASNGDHWENILKAIHSQDQNLWFLHNTNSNEYKAFRELVMKLRNETAGDSKPEVKPEDKYEPEFCLEDDDSYDENRPIKQEMSDGTPYNSEVKREDDDSQGNKDSESRRRERKRKSRWGNDPPADLKPPGLVAPLPPPVSGTKLAKIDEDGIKLTNVNRNNPALMQYAMTNYGTINLSAEDWKKCEDNFKLNLLYQDMLKKRQEVDRLAQAGKHKYEYDSDEDTSEGTWEHRLRAKEMCATEKWADELTKQAAGKHHIGDFLPPEELKKFMEKYSAVKSGKEPDLSDYKEFKLKEDNVGFKMLQKLGWNEGQGLGAEGSGIVEPINKANQPVANLGLGASTSDTVSQEDDEFDAYRKRMMLAYRFRPNPLNNPRRPYY